MEKVYRLLSWLDMAQAVDYLEDLTKTPLTEGLLLQLCDAGECAAYLDCMGLNGDYPFDVGEDQPAYQPVVGRGHCRVEYPLLLGRSGFATHVIGPAWLAFDGIVKEECEWIIRGGKAGLSLIFKPADIEALAAKMNGEPAPAERPLHPSERKSAGQIIAALAAMAKLDLSTPYAADETLRTAAATHGLELPSSPETVVKFFKDAATRTGKA